MIPSSARSKPWRKNTRRYTDAQLQAKTPELKERYSKRRDPGRPAAGGLCHRAGRQPTACWACAPIRVQLIGGIVLHQGRIAEMKTGEGKTLVATLPAYLNALTGEGVHIVTVNDYLAKRDSEWMGKVYRFLGLYRGSDRSTASTKAGKRQAAYNADITYGTNNEFGFDYLRDNMAIYKARAGAARPRLRHRGRGGLHPDRRGPDPPDHLRHGREVHPALRPWPTALPPA